MINDLLLNDGNYIHREWDNLEDLIKYFVLENPKFKFFHRLIYDELTGNTLYFDYDYKRKHTVIFIVLSFKSPLEINKDVIYDYRTALRKYSEITNKTRSILKENMSVFESRSKNTNNLSFFLNNKPKSFYKLKFLKTLNIRR